MLPRLKDLKDLKVMGLSTYRVIFKRVDFTVFAYMAAIYRNEQDGATVGITDLSRCTDLGRIYGMIRYLRDVSELYGGNSGCELRWANLNPFSM